MRVESSWDDVGRYRRDLFFFSIIMKISSRDAQI